MPYYAVAKGRCTGVFESWLDCKDQVDGYAGATFKKFDSAARAQEFVAANKEGPIDSTKASNSDYGYDTGSFSSSQLYGSSGYSPRSSDHFEKDSDGYVQVYTDGACSFNGRDGGHAGIGVYWGDGHPLNTSESVPEGHTHQIGEIQAATRAMKQAADNGIENLTINTASQFLIKTATHWMPGWKQEGWRLASGEPVQNEQDFREFDHAQSKLNVRWNFVEGHSGVKGYEKADQFAKAGASTYK